ncbi:MAG TPA: 50S ribosomal protein L9 [Miltoncostaeaceae bacterium]|nr:50S ribosomal protein L9 [Miltoncostaeaceae bacterium]
MQAILLDEVEGLGTPGTVVNVARGYMRNYLQPRGLAEVATPGRIAEIRRREEARIEAERKAEQQAREVADLLGRTILTLKAKAGDDGRLFGSITAADVATAIRDARGVSVDRHAITVEPPIRAVGTYTVPIDLGPGLKTEVKTIVSPLID